MSKDDIWPHEYHLGTENHQKVDVYSNRPLPVVFFVGLTQELGKYLKQEKEIKAVSLHLKCETDE